jgi:protein required for attachment to host cells
MRPNFQARKPERPPPSGFMSAQQDRGRSVPTHANLFDRLIIIAPPKILGQLRKAFHAEVVARIAAEIPKELTSHPISEIGKLVAA